MVMNAHAGSFNITTGAAASLVTVTDPGFTPEAVIYYWTGETGSTDNVARGDAFPGIGWCTSATSRVAIGGFTEDAVGNVDADLSHRSNACISKIDGVRNSDGLADFHSFNTNGFTVVIDEQFGTNLRVGYLALGGDITAATTGDFKPSSSGTQEVTVGFQPEFVLFANCSRLNAGPEIAGNLNISVGAATSATSRFVCCFSNDNGTNVGESYHYGYSGECCTVISSTGAAGINRADFDSFQANGFWVDWEEYAEGTQIYYLALAGGDYLVGDLATATDGSGITESSFGFQPAAAMFFSNSKAENAQDTPASDGKMSIGAFSATDQRSAQAWYHEDGPTDMEVSTALETDAVYVNISTTDATLDGLMDVQTINSDGFTMVMDDTDPAAYFVGYMAFGPGGTGNTVTSTPQDSFTFAGNQLRDFWGDRTVADDITLAENQLRDFWGTRTVSDIFTFADSLIPQILLLRLLSDSATFADNQLRDFVGTRTLNESIALTESLARDLIADRALQEALGFSEQHLVERWLDRLTQESIVLSEQLARDGVFTRDLQEVITFAENLDNTTTGGNQTVSKTLQDVFTFIDNLLTGKTTNRSTSDAFTFVDQTLRTAVFTRSATDSATFTDSPLTDLVLDRQLQDSLTLAENLAWNTARLRQIADEFNLTEQVVRDLILDRVLTDTLTLTENFVVTGAEAPAAAAEHWRLFTHHKWALRRRLWRRYMDLDIYPPQ
jgi:hypothetical protein